MGDKTVVLCYFGYVSMLGYPKLWQSDKTVWNEKQILCKNDHIVLAINNPIAMYLVLCNSISNGVSSGYIVQRSLLTLINLSNFIEFDKREKVTTSGPFQGCDAPLYIPSTTENNGESLKWQVLAVFKNSFTWINIVHWLANVVHCARRRQPEVKYTFIFWYFHTNCVQMLIVLQRL